MQKSIQTTRKDTQVLRIFSINGTKLNEVREQQFPLESEIQRLTEANLHDLFDLDFVKSEFGRQDVLPVTDLGIRKAMQKLYLLPELPKPATMLTIAQPWKPYRSIATWYLWKSLSKFTSIG